MEVARQRQALVRRQRGSGIQKQMGRGRAKLDEEAGKLLEIFSKDVAWKLLESTVGGNTTAARLLFALADGQIDCENEGVMRELSSFAETLAAEPQCDPKVVDAKAEFRPIEPER